jgi:hypothetical protein
MPTCVRRTPLVARAAALAAMLASVPASAQVNLSGVWNNFGILHEDWPDRLPGPELGDYAGLPINDAVRLRADSWDASLITLPEYQCRVHPSDYVSSFAGLRIWEERDSASQQLIAIHTHHFAWGTERTIWMDGRPHPPEYALHTAMGFSTGKWDGDILVVTTTHLKEGWTRRNGLTRSDKATVTEHLIRHGNDLVLVISVSDPTYYTEPVVRSRNYEYEVGGDIGPYPCEPVEEIIRPYGAIPHHLPGTNPFLAEYAKAHGIPLEAARGGAETMYPEYRKKIAEMMAAESKDGTSKGKSEKK